MGSRFSIQPTLGWRYPPMGVVAPPPSIFDLDLGLSTYIPGMAKRATSVFAASPIVQGDWDSTSGVDSITTSRGNLVATDFYDNIDGNQGSMVFWITPEWDGDDGKLHWLFRNGLGLNKATDNTLTAVGSAIAVDVSGWTAGTTYCVVFRWDTNNTLDGTNHLCISINDSHTFGQSSAPSYSPGATSYIGLDSGGDQSANAIIEGLTIYRRPLFDGAYGVDVGNGDEIAQIYNGGVGQDPTLVTGAFDVVFALPTDAVAGELVSDDKQAWTMPHSSNVLDNFVLEDGKYLGKANSLVFNGTTTLVNCGSDASLDNLHDGAFTVEAWIRLDGAGEGGEGIIANKAYTSGWLFEHHSSVGLIANVYCAISGGSMRSGLGVIPADGSWYHVAMTWDDATSLRPEIWINGANESNDPNIARDGAVKSDSSGNLIIGNRTTAQPNKTFNGLIAWVRISDNIRYTASFVPPSMESLPASDANTVALYNFDEGTGTSLADSSANSNTGTITDGTWKNDNWGGGGTPVTPSAVVFDGADTLINVGSDASLDNLHDGEFTAEAWFKADGQGESNAGRILHKLAGWQIYLYSSGIATNVFCATTNAQTVRAGSVVDSAWHHVAMYFNDAGDRNIYVALDGVWWGLPDITGVGAVTSDAANILAIGNRNDGTRTWNGEIAWVRISNNDRHGHGVDFTPPSRTNPPAADGNTVEQWNLDEAIGTLAAAQVNGSNDGTITSGTWNNSKNMSADSPADRVYNWGYVFGADANDEGITQTQSGLTPGENYVARVIAHTDVSSGANDHITLQVYDETNSAEITSYDFGASSTSDAPGVALITWELPTIARNGVGSDCVSMSVRVVANTAGATVYVHQVEVYENLIDNPSMATGSGDPWIPDGWTNSLLDAGDSEEELTIVHSGSSALKFNTGAVSAEKIEQQLPNSVGEYVMMGLWGYLTGGHVWLRNRKVLGTGGSIQTALAIDYTAMRTGSEWKFNPAVFRVTNATNESFQLEPRTGASGDRFVDDAFAVPLTPVTLTVVPASEANALESTGQRVGGYANLTQPITDITATAGTIRWKYTPRHSAGDVAKFGETESIVALFHKVNTWANIRVQWDSANILKLRIRIDGATTYQDTWDATGSLLAGTTYDLEIEYNATSVLFKVDSATKITVTPGPGIDYGADVPNVAYWGVGSLGSKQVDATFAAPD